MAGVSKPASTNLRLFLSAVSHPADNLPSEQLDDVDDSDDDSTETCDMEETMAVATESASAVTAADDDVAPPVPTHQQY